MPLLVITCELQGCLAMKMLAWEAPFTRSISGIRQKEVAFSGRMAQIRGLNLSLQFCMTPVVAFITFSVYIAMGNKVRPSCGPCVDMSL
jgi:ATP-binding cassette subfamily C (CFTR/MRP) protein 4